MSDVYIISACPKCGGMPIIKEEQLPHFLKYTYRMECEQCGESRYKIAFSPEDAIKEWEAHCKQETRSREDACTTRTD